MRIHLLVAAVALTLSFGQQPAPQTQPVAELRISGDVATPVTLSASDLKSMPRQTGRSSIPTRKKMRFTRASRFESYCVEPECHRMTDYAAQRWRSTS